LKHGNTAGGANLFELLYPGVKFDKLNYNLQRILLECIAYDSELEADHHDLEKLNSQADGKDKYTIVMKKGPREHKYMEDLQRYAQKSAANRGLVMAPVTLLTKKEYLKLGQSANYYRNIIGKGTA
jgi:hypothetical protein